MHQIKTLQEILDGDFCTCTMCVIPDYIWRQLNMEPSRPHLLPDLIPIKEILKDRKLVEQILRNIPATGKKHEED